MNLVELCRETEDRYRQYLKTTFYFRDPVLRRSFDQALASVAGRLSKGPFLEATPVFKRGRTARGLFQVALDGRADEGFLRAVAGDTTLYAHQEAAIKAVLKGRNVVLASGTGSGKTEAFLYPILLHLYRQSLDGALCPGVRALVLYPMNALANDQRQRFGDMCHRLRREGSPFDFTFGQYIGETPEDESDRRGVRGTGFPGELVMRSQMRETPPHILLTNYSMLEYLLLRPKDSPLFDNGNARWWTFLILDEAHQYRGARGAEMAMLLRRLKRRLVEGGRTEGFRCIATSATLAGRDEDKAAVARFASDLFGEEFDESDVILGETELIPDPGPKRLDPEDYTCLAAAIRQGPAPGENPLTFLARKLDVEVDCGTGADLCEAARLILGKDGRCTQLRRVISEAPVEVAIAADKVFADVPKERVTALCELVDLMLKVSRSEENRLLSARYHLFLRSLEGVFVSYYPEKRIVLDRRAQPGGALFEVALCRECGQHYLVGKIHRGCFKEPTRDPGNTEFKAIFLQPLESEEAAGGQEGEEEESQKATHLRLCVRCGRIGAGDPDCGHKDWLLVRQERVSKAEEKGDEMVRCRVCGYTAGGHDPVREVTYGRDGPHAVIATSLYQGLPEHRRKVLAFADSRQDAAFFAWYLQRTYEDILRRSLLLNVARDVGRETEEGLTLPELAYNLAEYRQREGLSRGREGTWELRRQAWIEVYREFLPDLSRTALEGVGLVRWILKWPAGFKVPQLLLSPPWSLDEAEARDLMVVLLSFMRLDGAVELRTEKGAPVQFEDLGLLQKRPQCVVANEEGKLKANEKRWAHPRGRRLGFPCRLLERAGLSPEDSRCLALEALRAIWAAIEDADRQARDPADRLLLPSADGRRLNPLWWRLQPAAEDDPLYRCTACGRLYAFSVRGVCPRHGCPGELKRVQRCALEADHYRSLYERGLPGHIRVEEHTAQLEYEKAHEYQQDFRENKIHVLSCSTTFELGVDLGDLDTVFLRNVPPEAFNYAQRVGRAGRRLEPGFAITYCGRGPHDLYHFSQPSRMLRGETRPPIISLRNTRIVTRHIAALALSAFFRCNRNRAKTVKDLFEDLTAPTAVKDFRDFLHGRRPELETSLRAIVPADLADEVRLKDGRWIDLVAGDESAMYRAEAERFSDYARVIELRERAKKANDYRKMGWADRRAKTLESEDALSFLSRKVVIPKYGFPVDVVELDIHTRQGSSDSYGVSLQRDLSMAVAEFAPTSKVVANKKEWVSWGLKRVTEREWPRKKYYLCPKHNLFQQWGPGEPEPKPPCECGLKPLEYVVPIFGFVTRSDTRPQEPRRRPDRVFTTRPCFVGPVDGVDYGLIRFPGGLTMKKACPGTMVVLCEGRGRRRFYVCDTCGAGFRSDLREPHQDPFGEECRGKLLTVSLGHEFTTDVVRLKFGASPTDGMDPIWFAYSVAYALLEGASESLQVPPTDLSTTVDARDADPLPAIVLYDNVPGGAGLVARLEGEDTLTKCLAAARDRVNGQCGCGEETSCYGCLRSYRNQFAHEHLQRGPVLDYLETLLSHWS